MKVQARFTDTRGNGVGRWRNYFDAEDLHDVRFAVRHLVPKAQIRVMDGRVVVIPPQRVEEFRASHSGV